jgi:hypothetical protein
MDIYLNCDTVDSPLLTSGIDWVQMDEDVDYLVLLTNGSVNVADGQPIPSTTQLNQAGLVLTGVEQVCTKYFLADDSVNLLKQIHNMGAGNKRYVFAFDFTEATGTASEPVLEAWDSVSMDSIDDVVLGEGTPSSSWIAGIVTTDALPGVGWSGVRLAGDSAGHFLNLNNGNGALTGADTLYCNLKTIVPATEVDGGVSNFVLVVKWTEV